MIRMSSRCCVVILGLAGTLAVLAYVISYFLIPWKKYEFEYPTGSRAVDSLRLIVVVSRNGNHGYGVDYPGDPYPLNDTRYWPYASNELSPRGRDQTYNLGLKIRSLYSGFIPVTFYPEDIRAASTAIDLTLMSGETFLAGLYQPRDFQVWYDALDWQPTALYSDSPDRTLDIIFSVCPVFEEESHISMKSFLEKYESNFTELSDYLTNATGFNFTMCPEKLLDLQQKAFSEKFEDFDLPDWLEAIYENLRLLVSDLHLAMYAGSHTNSRLLAGELADQILYAMVQKVNGSLTPDRKTFYYSGHGASIIALERILGVHGDSMVGMVKPGSGFIVELHKSNLTQEHFVQLVYLDGSSLEEEPLMFNMTGCGLNCSFVALLENARPYTGVNFHQECQLNSTTPTINST